MAEPIIVDDFLAPLLEMAEDMEPAEEETDEAEPTVT